MDEIKLVKPAEEYLPQIKAFREEFKDCLDWLHGAQGLREITDPTEWLRYSTSFESEQTVPEGLSPYSQFLCVRVSDRKNRRHDRRPTQSHRAACNVGRPHWLLRLSLREMQGLCHANAARSPSVLQEPGS